MSLVRKSKKLYYFLSFAQLAVSQEATSLKTLLLGSKKTVWTSYQQNRDMHMKDTTDEFTLCHAQPHVPSIETIESIKFRIQVTLK